MTLSGAIIKTLAYSDHFDFPLTLEEIHLRLVGARFSRLQIITKIHQMLKQGSLIQTGDFYHFPNRKSLVNHRLARAKLSQTQLARAESLSARLSSLSSVLAIYLTGSLAMKNSAKTSDIDFMIITKPNQLWTTRLILTLYTSLLGLRRTPHSQKNSGKLCLNLYLTPTSYGLPNHKQSLYTAYELIQAVPLYDPYDTHSALLAENSWIKKYLSNFPLPKPKNTPLYDFKTLRLYDKLVEYFLYHLQLWYMRPKLTREYITKDSAFFHPHDPSPRV